MIERFTGRSWHIITVKVINNETLESWSVHFYLWSERLFSGTDPSEISRKLKAYNFVIAEFQKPVNGDRLYESQRLVFNVISYPQTII